MNISCLKYSKGKLRQYKKFIKMCEKAKEIQDNHFISKGDCVYHPKEGVFEVLIIRNDRIKATPERELECLLAECIWLPSKKDLINMAEELNLSREGLNMFLEDRTGTYHYWPCAGLFFRMPEDQWLAYYMFERYNKIWLLDEQKWSLR